MLKSTKLVLPIMFCILLANSGLFIGVMAEQPSDSDSDDDENVFDDIFVAANIGMFGKASCERVIPDGTNRRAICDLVQESIEDAHDEVSKEKEMQKLELDVPVVDQDTKQQKKPQKTEKKTLDLISGSALEYLLRDSHTCQNIASKLFLRVSQYVADKKFYTQLGNIDTLRKNLGLYVRAEYRQFLKEMTVQHEVAEGDNNEGSASGSSEDETGYSDSASNEEKK